MKLEDAMPLLTDHDREAVEDFQRFLDLGLAPGDGQKVPAEWIPYCEGGPAPPQKED